MSSLEELQGQISAVEHKLLLSPTNEGLKQQRQTLLSQKETLVKKLQKERLQRLLKRQGSSGILTGKANVMALAVGGKSRSYHSSRRKSRRRSHKSRRMTRRR